MKYLKKIFRFLSDSSQFFYLGFKKKLFKDYLKAFFTHLFFHLNKFHYYLLQSLQDHKKQYIILHKKIQGLHTLLPNSHDFTYSILIALDQPKINLFKNCVASACMQTAPNSEILIGSKNAFSAELLKIIEEASKEYPKKIKWHEFLNNDQPLYNLLAEQSSGKFLVILKQEDTLRPDFLFRYEQLLRKEPWPEKTVINCEEKLIDGKGDIIPTSCTKKKQPQFPYLFQRYFDLKGILLPKILWEQAGGIRIGFVGAEIEDLLLRLNLACAEFKHIPLPLYYSYFKAKNQSLNMNHFQEALKDYSTIKGLDWVFEPGYHPGCVRAIPKQNEHTIQVVIPFKNQKELTLRCIESVFKQQAVSIKVTAIDNESDDLTIGFELENMGVEVLRINEPFNYSRLNNLAIAQTTQAKECDLILFLNNDVELDERALSEMVRWIDQPFIGMVGARLHYPNGMLQHGGVKLHEHFYPDQMCWEHIEKFKLFEEMQETKVQAITDAVTAACALVKKEHFIQVGGFDEVWYPIAFSDTSLALKLKQIGLNCFYTPYAFGIHYESISRKHSLEDVENSRWLHNLIFKN